jgi:hypothetical protein
MRDEFPENIKNVLRLRAGNCCSYCKKLTSGPSQESPTAFASDGVAAHISAASDGGRRYDPSMTKEKRSSINNGIWLCASHAVLIDRNETTFTIPVLKTMKADHEAWAFGKVLGGPPIIVARPAPDLFAIGPDNVFLGEMLRIKESEWVFRVQQPVIGDTHSLSLFIDSFETAREYDRYVVANAQGDGRVLANAPVWSTEDGYAFVTCPVERRSPRTRADMLPADLDFTGGDLSINDRGDIATVAGLKALPQKIKLGLGVRRGELMFHRDFGSRLAEYYKLFLGSHWLERIFKLEVARLASIPFPDPPQGAHTPLSCVDRVLGLKALPEKDGKVPMTVELQIHGFGHWSGDIEVFVE